MPKINGISGPSARKPIINPTENITTYGQIAGGAQQGEAPRALVTFINGDDWDGLFINGKRVYEGHSIPAFHMLPLLKDVGRYAYEEFEADQAALETICGFPETLEQARLYGIIR